MFICVYMYVCMCLCARAYVYMSVGNGKLEDSLSCCSQTPVECAEYSS